MTAPASLHTSRQGDRNSTPQISQEWSYYSSLPLPRVWQVQAHVPTCFYSFCCLLLISTHTVNSPLFLTADVTLLHDFWTRTTSPRSLLPCLDATCLWLQGDTEPCSPALTLRHVMSLQVIKPQSHQVLTSGSAWHPKCLLYPSMKVWERQTASQVSGFIPWQRPCHMTACAQRHSPPWLTTSENKECQWMKSWIPSTHSFTGQAALNSNIHPPVKVQHVAHKKQQAGMPLLKSTYSLERDVKKMKYGVIFNVQIHSGFLKGRALENNRNSTLFGTDGPRIFFLLPSALLTHLTYFLARWDCFLGSSCLLLYR